jgi:hypothetical protein
MSGNSPAWPDARRVYQRIKVPDVAKAMNAEWCDIYDMLDRLKARFT